MDSRMVGISYQRALPLGRLGRIDRLKNTGNMKEPPAGLAPQVFCINQYTKANENPDHDGMIP